MGVFTDIIDNRNKPKRGLVNEAGNYGGVELDEEGRARRRKLFFDKLPAFKKRNQRKWEKANPKLNEPMPYERKRSYIPSPQRRQELEELIEEGARLGASSGGLMNLTRTIPPESGPNAKGLESLRRYATRKY